MTKIITPNCEFCGAEEAHICRNCDKWTCYECVVYPSDSECIHKKYEPIKNWSWEKNDNRTSAMS